jgi:hypothetical protein
MSMHESFNQSGFAKFINSPVGRAFRIVVGIGFLVVGYIYRHHTLGIISMVWSIFPIGTGLFDLCTISAILGGPLSGAKIRSSYKKA